MVPDVGVGEASAAPDGPRVRGVAWSPEAKFDSVKPSSPVLFAKSPEHYLVFWVPIPGMIFHK